LSLTGERRKQSHSEENQPDHEIHLELLRMESHSSFSFRIVVLARFNVLRGRNIAIPFLTAVLGSKRVMPVCRLNALVKWLWLKGEIGLHVFVAIKLDAPGRLRRTRERW
jgi:hypothetical protein